MRSINRHFTYSLAISQLCIVRVIFRDDKRHEYINFCQSVAPMEHRLRDAQLVCTVIMSVVTLLAV